MNNEEVTIKFSMSVANRPVKFLIDSGSSISLINQNLVKSEAYVLTNKKIEIIGATGHSATTVAMVNSEILIENKNINHDFHIYDRELELNTDGILGWDFLKKFKCNIDFENKKLILQVPISGKQNEITVTKPKEVVVENKQTNDNTIGVSSQSNSMKEKNSKGCESQNDNTISQVNQYKNFNKNLPKKTYNPYLKSSNIKIKNYKIPEKIFQKSIQVRHLSQNTRMSEYVKTNIGCNQIGIIIPERCEQILEIDTHLENKNHLLCTTEEILPNVRIKNKVLENKCGKIQLVIQNFNEFPIKLTQNNFKSLKFEQTKNYHVFSLKIPQINDTNDRFQFINKKLDTSHCNDKEKEIIRKLCKDNTDCFFIDGDPINHTDLIEHSIELKPGSKPVFTKQYRLPESQKREIRKQLEKMESEGIIEKCVASGWNSPLLLVPKASKEGEEKKFRLVVDFRKLNESTVPMQFPIPHIDSIIDTFGGACYFSTLDLNGAFYQIKLRKDR